MELFRFAVAGFNIIPTVMLGMILLYWIIAILGLVDFEVFEIDVDLDLEGGDSTGPLSGIAMFLNLGEVPFALALSLIVLNFWVIAMFLNFIPVEAGGIWNGLMLIPAFIAAFYITKVEIMPLKGMFRGKKRENGIEHKVMDKYCVLLCDVQGDRLGQARIEQEGTGTGVVINVRTEFASDKFTKGETAYVFRKDDEENIYYITRPTFYKTEA